MEIQPFLDNRHDQIEGNGNPDLCLYSVLRSSVKALDAQVLLDPFEEKLYLPSLFVELGDSEGGQQKVVGQKHQGFVGSDIVVSHSAKLFGIIPGRLRNGQQDGLIAQDTCGFVHRMGIDSAELQICLGPDNKER